MAESDSSNSWWYSLLNTAKEKSISAYNITKKDLAEFVTTVQNDTTKAVTEAADTVRSYINQDDTDDADDNSKPTDNSKEITTTKGDHQCVKTDQILTYDRNQTELETIRANPSTYTSIPEGRSDDYIQWSSNFDLSSQQEEISRLLISSDNVRRLHSDLVPGQVSYESFWHHYFYRIHLMSQAESKRAELMARAFSQSQMIRWDDEEEEPENKPRPSNMTDSSESFVCVNEDDLEKNETEEEKDIATCKEKEESQSPPPTIGIHDDDDSDWEKWDD